MNSKSRQLARLSGLVATIVGMVFFTAAQATAMRPDPQPDGPVGVPAGSGTPSVLPGTESSISSLEWVLFAVAVIAALLVGAALTHLAERRRFQLAA